MNFHFWVNYPLNIHLHFCSEVMDRLHRFINMLRLRHLVDKQLINTFEAVIHGSFLLQMSILINMNVMEGINSARLNTQHFNTRNIHY